MKLIALGLLLLIRPQAQQKSFPAGDGCNTCSGYACTVMACVKSPAVTISGLGKDGASVQTHDEGGTSVPPIGSVGAIGGLSVFTTCDKNGKPEGCTSFYSDESLAVQTPPARGNLQVQPGISTFNICDKNGKPEGCMSLYSDGTLIVVTPYVRGSESLGFKELGYFNLAPTAPTPGRVYVNMLSEDEYRRITEAEAALAKVKSDIAKAHDVVTEERCGYSDMGSCLTGYQLPDHYEFRGQFLLVNVPEAK